MIFRKLFVLGVLLSGAVLSRAQDLNARVKILSQQIQNTNQRSFDQLETAIRDFLNNRKWSNDPVRPMERIDCNFVINITQWDGSASFQADAQIQSSRPVFGSSYTSTILNISDKDFAFTYQDGQPLDYTDQAYQGNLSSLLAFYAYVIVGMDYDTYSRFGGSSYYQRAQTVVNNAQNASFAGWKAFENLKNRYWVAENLNNKAFNPIRETLYDYHRNGLDIMAGNRAKGRKEVLSTLSQLQKLDRQKQGSILNQLFFSAKATELVNIAGQADPQDRMRAYNQLIQLDPSNLAKYELLKK